MNLSNEKPIMRVLKLLSIMAEHDNLSLEEAHVLTGLSKATLLRAFLSLEQAGWVHRYLGSRKYTYINNSFDNYNLYDNQSLIKKRLAVIVKPVLENLYQITKLSSDVSFMFDELVIVESSFGLTESRIEKRSVIGLVVDFENSAMGRAYASSVSGLHKEGIYYKRENLFWGYDDVKQRFDISAIGVPILVSGQTVGAINITWFGDDEGLCEAEVIADKYLDALYSASVQISKSIQDSNISFMGLIGACPE